MKYRERSHYLVHTHYSAETQGLKCFETSDGAIAYIVAQSRNSGLTCTVECLTHAACPHCNP